MAEGRATTFPRKKRRYLVEFALEGSSCCGFSQDMSASGIFVRSARLPDTGTILTLSLLLSDGRRLALRGKVVRTRRVPGRLSTIMPSGFAVRITDAPEGYYQLLATL